MELLAPAGTMEHFMAALEAGADAVYLGGKVFNARSHAGNFEYDELREAVRLGHILGVSIFVTVNIIVGDKELGALKNHLLELERIGVDGIIVQDLGVAEICKTYTPNLELHASTQLTATNLGTVKFLERLGFTRVVLSRELSLEEIRHICKEAKAEIEVFVHGALCISYSGQCLMSSFIGGRSGNRGSCAQPCRLPYDLVTIQGQEVTKENETYIMSPKDLNYSTYMKELIEAGVSSFKIEGRMKKVSYVKEVIGTYRRIIDRAGQYTVEDMQSLEQGFNRGFSTAYLENRGSRHMMTIVAPNHQGKRIGEARLKGKKLYIDSTELLHEGDLLKVISKSGEVAYYTVDERWQKVDSSTWHGHVEDGIEGILYLASSKGDKKSRGLQEFTRKHNLYAYLDGREGEQPTLTLVDEKGNSVTVTNDYVVQIAQKKVTPISVVKEQLGRLGNTLFKLVDISMPEEPFMWPSSVLNQLRRDAVQALENLYVSTYEEEWHERRNQIDKIIRDAVKERPSYCFADNQEEEKESSIVVQVDTFESVRASIKAGAKKIHFGGDELSRIPLQTGVYDEIVQYCKDHNVWITLGTPRIVRDLEEVDYKVLLRNIVNANPHSIKIHFLGALEWLSELGYKGLVEGDTSLQVFNSRFSTLLESLGISVITASQECTLEQITYMAREIHVPVECVVQGYTEVMISEYCPISSFAGTGEKRNCPAPCTKDNYALRDRKGELFPIRTDAFCRTHILNSRELEMRSYALDLVRKGVKYLRIDGRQQSAQWIEERVKDYIEILAGRKVPPSKDAYPFITRGHYFKGITNI